MDPNFLLGALLVGVGLALAALAYSLITERASSDTETEADTPDTPEETSPDETSPSAALEAAAPDKAGGLAVEEEDLPSPEGEPEVEAEEGMTGVESETQTIQQQAPKEAVRAPKPEPPKLRPTFPVATLMRDEVTGALMIQVGDEIYRSKEELQASKDWGRVSFAAEDLAKWMEGEPTDISARPPAARRTPSGKTERGKEGDAPRSMVEEIDEILQEMLVASSHAERAVRLLEGPGGTARVLIGIDSYSIEEVPHPEIKKLIQEAVATWEATR